MAFSSNCWTKLLSQDFLPSAPEERVAPGRVAAWEPLALLSSSSWDRLWGFSRLSGESCFRTTGAPSGFQSSTTPFHPGLCWALPCSSDSLHRTIYMISGGHLHSPPLRPQNLASTGPHSFNLLSPPYPSGRLPGHISQALLRGQGWIPSCTLLYCQHPAQCQEHSSHLASICCGFSGFVYLWGP